MSLRASNQLYTLHKNQSVHAVYFANHIIHLSAPHTAPLLLCLQKRKKKDKLDKKQKPKKKNKTKQNDKIKIATKKQTKESERKG